MTNDMLSDYKDLKNALYKLKVVETATIEQYVWGVCLVMPVRFLS